MAGIVRLEPSVATKTPLLSVEMDSSSNGGAPGKNDTMNCKNMYYSTASLDKFCQK